MKIKCLGNIYGASNPKGRLYDISGIAPTLNTSRGGSKVPLILDDRDKTSDKKRLHRNSSGGGCFDMSYPNSKTRRGRVEDNGDTSPTLTKHTDLNVLEEEKPLRIRRLTPREYFRLQGWADDYFEKAQLVNSDTQLYAQAGNGVTVNVIEEIGRKLR